MVVHDWARHRVIATSDTTPVIHHIIYLFCKYVRGSDFLDTFTLVLFKFFILAWSWTLYHSKFFCLGHFKYFLNWLSDSSLAFVHCCDFHDEFTFFFILAFMSIVIKISFTDVSCNIFWLETGINVQCPCQLYQILLQRVSNYCVRQVYLKRKSHKKIWCVLCACN